MRAILAVLAIVCACAIALPTQIENGFFDGRSGDILIQPKTSISQTSLSFLGSNAPKVAGSLEVTQVADLLSHLLGTASLNANADRTAFPKKNFFASAKANLMFVVDADSSELEVLTGAPSQNVNGLSLPQDSAAILNSILTGTHPSKHGIVQSTWFNVENGIEVSAFESWCPGRSGARSASLQDITGLAHGGRSLVLSFASDLATSRAMATKPYLMKDTANNFGLYFDGSSFASVYADRVVQMDVDSPAQLLANYPLPSVLDTTVQEVAALLSEVAFVMALPERLNTDATLKALVEDDVPDYYSFAFSGLKALRALYGANSAEYKAAVALVNSAIREMTQFVENTYNAKALIEVVSLPVVVYENKEQILEKTASALPELASQNAQVFPQVYLNPASTQRESLCALLEQVLTPLNAQVECLPASAASQAYLSARAIRQDESLGNTTGDGADGDEVATFQIVLWSAIALIFLTLAAAYLMFTIDASKDTMIYNQHNQINVPTI